MSFIDGDSRDQINLLPACVDDYVASEDLVRVVDAFVANLDLADLGFNRVVAAATGRVCRHRAFARQCIRPGASSAFAGPGRPAAVWRVPQAGPGLPPCRAFPMEGVVESRLAQDPATPGNDSPGRERQDRQRYDNEQYQYNAAHHTLCVIGVFTLKPIRH